MTPRCDIAAIDADGLARAFRAGAQALEANAAAIDAINVFPVPDGDTGTNMSSTMRSAVDAAVRADRNTAQAVAEAAARGALMGAKGNSGVILSQILYGFAAMPPGERELDARGVADALDRGRIAAYRVVSEPKEGTILTAIAAAADAARVTDSGAADAALGAAVAAAHDAVARSPEMLPVLKEAGVVDSGAQGLYVMLDGMLRGLRGESPAAVDDLGHIDAAFLAGKQRLHDGGDTGYCTEFMVEGRAIEASKVRERLSAMGSSVLVVEAPGMVRVHLHTATPDEAIEYGHTLGDVSRVKVEDLQGQIDALANRLEGAAAPAIAVVAVAPGDGIARLFRSIGASEIVHGGQTMNPSAGEMREVIDRTRAQHVIVLPNNGNVIMAAQQAASMGTTPEVRVVASVSVPQGVAALVAVNPDAPFDVNVAAMESALGPVRTAEVTLAARATRIDGRDVPEGAAIAIIDGELTLVATSVEDAAVQAVGRMIDGREAPLVTLYFGEGLEAGAAAAVAQRIGTEFGCDVETVEGGQPHYPYLIGVE